MTIYSFTPPTVEALAWDQSSKLFRHYGTLPVGRTIYKDAGGVWHTLNEGYDPALLEGAQRVYLGGREYEITQDEYNDLASGGFIDLPGFFLGPECFLGPSAFPGDGTQ